MCWKKIFGCGATNTTIGYSGLTFLTQIIDDYPGTENDLEKCHDDQAKLIKVLPQYQIRRYADSEVTEKLFVSRHLDILGSAIPGDTLESHYSRHGTKIGCPISVEPDGYYEGLYLYGSVLTDKEFKVIRDAIPAGVTVAFILDSCFSGGMSKGKNNPGRAKFVQTEDRILTKRVGSMLAGIKSEELNCIIMSACSEGEVAYDGAFSPVLAAMRKSSTTYRDWFNKTSNYIATHGGRQTPVLYGPDYLLDKIMP